MRKRTLIPKQNAAVTIQELFTAGSIVADGDLAANEIAFSHVGINDQDLTDAYDEDLQPMVLKAAKPGTAIPFPSHLNIAKPLTDNPVGVYVLEKVK